MSKAFTKEDDSPGTADLQDLPQTGNPNYITPEGLKALRARLEAAEASEADLRARSDEAGQDLHLAAIEREIRFLHDRIGRAIVVDPHHQPPGVVAFGAEVDVVDEDGATHTFRILGEDEADPAKGRITPFSPLGRALIGGEVGSEAVWDRPKGPLSMEITAIRYP
jgi:transcription elongation GreA/GreB family factor